MVTQQAIMQIAPILAYFVYDGFQQDLDAALIYERLMNHSTTDDSVLTHLKEFLLACLTGHNAGDMDADAVAQYNNEDDPIEAASLVSVSKLRALKKNEDLHPY